MANPSPKTMLLISAFALTAVTMFSSGAAAQFSSGPDQRYAQYPQYPPPAPYGQYPPPAAYPQYPAGPAPQNQYIYPNKGQTQDQQGRDRYECHNWSAGQTGYDPTRAPPQVSGSPPPTANTEQALGNAAIGVLEGALGGGASTAQGLTGALTGQQNQTYSTQGFQSPQAPAYQQQASNYDRAMKTCLEGRGYTVN